MFGFGNARISTEARNQLSSLLKKTIHDLVMLRSSASRLTADRNTVERNELNKIICRAEKMINFFEETKKSIMLSSYIDSSENVKTTKSVCDEIAHLREYLFEMEFNDRTLEYRLKGISEDVLRMQKSSYKSKTVKVPQYELEEDELNCAGFVMEWREDLLQVLNGLEKLFKESVNSDSTAVLSLREKINACHTEIDDIKEKAASVTDEEYSMSASYFAHQLGFAKKKLEYFEKKQTSELDIVMKKTKWQEQKRHIISKITEVLKELYELLSVDLISYKVRKNLIDSFGISNIEELSASLLGYLKDGDADSAFRIFLKLQGSCKEIGGKRKVRLEESARKLKEELKRQQEIELKILEEFKRQEEEELKRQEEEEQKKSQLKEELKELDRLKRGIRSKQENIEDSTQTDDDSD